MLYICATPIGNLDDITLRVINKLKEVDLIATEDTRHTSKLLNHLGIKKKLVSYHQHNSKQREEYFLEILSSGQNVALVCDAGMPCISDPGSGLIQLCIKHNLEFTVLPGATASLTALLYSGFSADKFFFEGFLSSKKGERAKRLNEISGISETLIFYEAPHRILSTLKDFRDVFGNRNIAVARELTKIYEQILRMNISDMIEYFECNPPRGEFVVVVEGCPTSEAESIDISKEFNKLMQLGANRNKALSEISRRTGRPRREIYKMIFIDERLDQQ